MQQYKSERENINKKIDKSKCIKVCQEFYTYRIRAGVSVLCFHMQEQNTTEKKEKSERSK